MRGVVDPGDVPRIEPAVADRAAIGDGDAEQRRLAGRGAGHAGRHRVEVDARVAIRGQAAGTVGVAAMEDRQSLEGCDEHLLGGRDGLLGLVAPDRGHLVVASHGAGRGGQQQQSIQEAANPTVEVGAPALTSAGSHLP